MSQTHILKVTRLDGLTDGIFAIAMTILILNLTIPPHLASSHISALIMTNILSKLFVYVGSFIILGTLWLGMHFQMGYIDHVNRPYLWTHILYLMLVCIVPFSANLIASYPDSTIAISFYALNLMCASLAQFLIAMVAGYYQLNNAHLNHKIHQLIIQRIYVAPCLYLLALLAAHWNTHVAFILLICPTLFYILPGRVDKFETLKEE